MQEALMGGHEGGAALVVATRIEITIVLGKQRR